MANRPLLDLTVRGVELREETLFYVRRCFRRLQQELAREDERVSVLLERIEGSVAVRAFVALGEHESLPVGYGEDPDELLATSCAFALLRERLEGAPRSWRPADLN